MTKVLYVEHNDDNIYMLKTRLELLGGFEVLAAGDSESGCELAVTEHPDVILMDPCDVSGTIRIPTTSRSSACPRMRWRANASRPLPRDATSSMPNRSNSIAWSQPSGACLRTPNRCSDRGDQDGTPPGRRTVNTEPLPGSLATVTSPPIKRASLRVMARPSPVPPKRCAVVASALRACCRHVRLCAGQRAARKPSPLAATSSMPNRSTSSLWSPPFVASSRTRNNSFPYLVRTVGLPASAR